MSLVNAGKESLLLLFQTGNGLSRLWAVSTISTFQVLTCIMPETKVALAQGSLVLSQGPVIEEVIAEAITEIQRNYKEFFCDSDSVLEAGACVSIAAKASLIHNGMMN